MKLKTLIGVMGMLLPMLSATAQDIRPLNIGDAVPDLILHNIINYKDSTARISDFRGKLLILDFWATWCTSCIASFPHNNEMLRQLGDEMQILNVTADPASKVAPFLTGLEQRRGNGYRITSVTGDTILQAFFPHNIIPHLVWIGPDGKIKAITSDRQLVKANIDKILQEKQPDFQQKKDIVLSSPAFLNEVITTPPFNLLHYSLLVNGNLFDGSGASQRYFQTDSGFYGVNFTNYTLKAIFTALGYHIWSHYKMGNFSAKVLKLEGLDTSDLAKLSDSTWQMSYFLPKKQSDSFFFKVLNEIETYTGLSARVKKREIPCLLLVRTSGRDKIHSAVTSKPENTLFGGDSCVISNYPVRLMVNRLGMLSPEGLPVLDGTGYTGNVDLSFRAPYTMASVRNQLKKYDLDLLLTKKSVNIMLVTQKKQ